MKYCLLVLLGCFLFSCQNAKQGFDFELEKIEGENTDAEVYKVRILQGQNELQEIRVHASFPLEASSIETADWNRDGHLDFVIPAGGGSGGVLSDVWLFDQNVNQFIKHHALSSMYSIRLDSTNQQIKSHFREGWDAGVIHSYEIVDTSLKLIEEMKISRWMDNQQDEFLQWESRERYIHKTGKKSIDSCIMRRESRTDTVVVEYKWMERMK